MWLENCSPTATKINDRPQNGCFLLNCLDNLLFSHKKGQSMNQYDIEKFIAPTYQQRIYGLKLTPEQDDELRKLYSRATVPVRSWRYIFLGLILAEITSGLYCMERYIQIQDKKTLAIWSLSVLSVVAALFIKGYRMQVAKKQFDHKINEIKSQNFR